MFPEYLGDPFASEKITLGVPVGRLTAATFATKDHKAKNAVITTDITTDFRFTIDGATPTASDGHFVDVSVDRTPIVLRGFQAIEKFRALGNGAVLYVTYFR